MILHLDFSTGASGDKLLGALLELCEVHGTATFADLERVGKALIPLVTITREHVVKGGIAATHLMVEEPSPPVRHWHEIRTLIELAGDGAADKTGPSPAAAAPPAVPSPAAAAPPAHHHSAVTATPPCPVLSPAAAALALRAFEAVAVAEATVHGRPLDHVHFHEVGGADSIIDIVGSSFLLDRLQPTAVYATPLALGNGTFVCAHGELPVPAPATARIIEGLPVYASSHEGELTTPTGAALAKAFVTHWAPLPPLAPTGLGHGAGSRDLPGAPNVVRVIAGEPVSLAGLGDALTVEGCVLLHTNIDHRTPEELAFACEELLAAGALDVWQEPITMKKGRLAVRVSVLCHAARAQELTQKTIALTGSLGVRSQYVERTVIPREAVTLDTPYGPVPFKAAAIDTPAARTAWLRPEHEAVAHIARAQGLDYHTLYEELSGLARARCQHP
jgi:uncharacterized protein (TIGR00299 family) protein